MSRPSEMKRASRTPSAVEYSGILVRDNTGDTGVIPSPGRAYRSPDIICVQQATYADPAGQFGTAQSYSSDPNQTLIAGQNNNFYVRGKNLAAASLGGKMYVYWSKSSLLLVLDEWIDQPLSSYVGGRLQGFVDLPQIASSQVTVGATAFNWTPPPISSNDHFCMVGAVNDQTHAWPPQTMPTFPTMGDFVLWVREHQNICWRNLTLVANPSIPDWDRLDSFTNKWAKDVPLFVKVVCSAQVLEHTTIQVLCQALNLNETFDGMPGQTFFTKVVVCPANFDGFVETMARLPAGVTSWPEGAEIGTTVYVGFTYSAALAPYAEDFRHRADHQVEEIARLVGAISGNDGQAIIVEVGNTSTGYRPAD